jgi:hypothetical protein
MRAINHALTGAAVGLVVTNPAIALPLAIMSHFVLDTVPHHTDDERFPKGSKAFNLILLADALLCGLLVLVLFFSVPGNWLLPAVCAFLATSPDLMWIRRFLVSLRTGNDPGPSGIVEEFHSIIQWKAWPGGVWIETAWAITALFVLSNLI